MPSLGPEDFHGSTQDRGPLAYAGRVAERNCPQVIFATLALFAGICVFSDSDLDNLSSTADKDLESLISNRISFLTERSNILKATAASFSKELPAARYQKEQALLDQLRKCSATLDVFKEVLELNGSDQIVDVVGAPNLERYRTAAGECFRICIQNLQSTVATLENYRPAHSSPLKESFTGFRWDLERLIELTHTTTVSPRERTLLTSTPAYSSGKSVSQLWFDSVRNVSYLLAMGLECKSVTVSRTD